jgi:hypothetical protein
VQLQPRRWTLAARTKLLEVIGWNCGCGGLLSEWKFALMLALVEPPVV